MYRITALIIFLCTSSASSQTAERELWLKKHGQPPVEYILSSFADHRIVIAGEAHWIRHDAELIAATVPRLASAGVGIVAVETLSSDSQERIDRLISADTWDETESIAVLRRAAWPYQQYGDILRAAWEANRKAPSSVRVLGLGPPLGWRETRLDYDEFMARRILDAIGSDGRALVYLGLHHAFTRYEQPTVLDNGRADGFMDRAGNMLRRGLGDSVFLIVLHRPFWSGSPSRWGYALPANGYIDCAAGRLGRPIGFDLQGSPFGSIEMDRAVYYAHGYPSLRLIDFADGWIWFTTIENYRGAELIPLSKFAPDAIAMDEVRANNPFSNKTGLTDSEIETLWSDTREKMKDYLAMRRWSDLPQAMEHCPNLP